MRIREGFIIKKLGDEHVVVTVGQASEDFNGLIRLNSAGAFLWQLLEGEASRDRLLGAMLERYDGLDEATAAKDLDEFLRTVEFALEE